MARKVRRSPVPRQVYDLEDAIFKLRVVLLETEPGRRSVKAKLREAIGLLEVVARLFGASAARWPRPGGSTHTKAKGSRGTGPRQSARRSRQAAPGSTIRTEPVVQGGCFDYLADPGWGRILTRRRPGAF